MDGASEEELRAAAEALETDLNDFEAIVWPVFRDRGYSKDSAVLCYYLHLTALSVQKLWEDDE